MREEERRSLFIRFMIGRISVPALITCFKMLREGEERVRALLLLALLDMHQSKPMRKNMKEPVELEPMHEKDRRSKETPNQGAEAH